MHPYEFLSVYGLVMEGLKAVTDKNVSELMPKDIVSKSKIYNIISALQFKDLYGIKLIKDFKANLFELKELKDYMMNTWIIRRIRNPGEEYELVQHWAEDLKLDKFFEPVDKGKYRQRSDLDKVIENIKRTH